MTNSIYTDTIFDTLKEDTKNGYHIFLNEAELNIHSITKKVFYLRYSVPTEYRYKKVWHEECEMFPCVGKALIVFKNKRPVKLYQLSKTQEFKDNIRLHNVTISIL